MNKRISHIVSLVFLLNTISFFGQTDTTKQRIKIDGVAAVIGDYVILDSDIDKAYVDLQSQGIPTKNIERCSLLGKLMEDKL